MQISQEDVNTAIRLWRVSVPKQYQRLLEARDVTNVKNDDLEKYLIAGLIVFAAGSYFNPTTSAFISWLAVRNALESVIDTTGVSINQSTQQMIDGKITRDEWEKEMQRDILALMIVSALAAHGGVNLMTRADWQAISTQATVQYAYLKAFSDEIAAGLALDGKLLSRADLYADAGRSAFEEARTIINERNGWEEERRNLEEGATHCEGCIDQADLDWQPIGTLDPIGAEECGTRCKCTKQYRKQVNGHWIETEAE